MADQQSLGNQWSGQINRIQVAWSPSGQRKLEEQTSEQQVELATLKYVIEYFLYHAAVQTGSYKVLIR